MADVAKYFGGIAGIVLPSASIPDPYVPVDGTMNVTGAVAASTAIVAGTWLSTGTAKGIRFVGVAGGAAGTDANIQTTDEQTMFFNVASGANNGLFHWTFSGGQEIFTLADHATNYGATVTGKALIDGQQDVVQLTVQGHSTQTTLPFVVENSAGTDQFTVSNTGVVTALGPATVGSGTTTDAIIVGGQAIGATYPSILNASENTTTGWAMIPGSNGNTYLNGRTGMAFNIANVQKADLTASRLALTAGMGLAVGGVTAVKSAAYTATVADSLVLADPAAAAGSFAVTLPAASAAQGQLLTVKVTAIDATKVITVIRAGADTIEGITAAQTTTTFTTTATLASATFQSDGTSKWYLIASNGTVT